MGIPIIRWLWDRLIFIIGMPMQVWRRLYIETTKLAQVMNGRIDEWLIVIWIKWMKKHFIGSTEHCCIAQNLIKEKNTAKTAWSIARCRTTTWNIPRCRTTTWNILRCFTGTTTWDIPWCRAPTWNIPRCRRTNWDISRCFTGTTMRNIPKCRTAT